MLSDMTLLTERMRTAVGPLTILTDGDGVLRALGWEDGEARMHRLLEIQYGCTIRLERNASRSTARAALDGYFAGDLHAIDALPVATGGTPFQRRVWTALRDIPAGSTSCYGELAQRIGCPGAARAVGAANGANPISIVLPCHRVIGAGGRLTGYGGGMTRKQWLLEHEGFLLSSDRQRIAS